MNPIDHPLLEAERVMASGWMDPAFIDRVKAEYYSGPQTAAALRASIFELLGDGFSGRVPVAIEEVVEIEPGDWMALGCVDDGTVLKLADGSTFLGVTLPEVRQMVTFALDTDQAAELEGMLKEGRGPVWTLDPLRVLALGDEITARREIAAFDMGDDQAASS